MPVSYEYVPESKRDCYATRLSYQRGKRLLVWDSAPGLDVLLVELPFGEDAQMHMVDEICPALSACELVPGRYVSVSPQVSVRRVTAIEKSRDGGCAPHSEGRTYTVFALKDCGDTTQVCYSCAKGIVSPRCDVPLELHVSVDRVTREEGRFFNRHTVETDFCCLSFPSALSDDLHDGDLAYRVGSYQIPLTRRALEQGTVYVKSPKAKPVVVASSAGIRLI